MDNVSGLPTNIKIGSNNKKGDFENPFSDTDTPLFQSFLLLNAILLVDTPKSIGNSLETQSVKWTKKYFLVD